MSSNRRPNALTPLGQQPTPGKKNSPSQDLYFKAIGPSLRIFQLNIEGLSSAKRDYLSNELKNYNIDVIVLQETRIPPERGTNTTIAGFTLVAAKYHQKHGILSYVKNNIKNNVSTIEESPHSVTIKIGQTTIVNVYKPPSEQWSQRPFPIYDHPCIYIGDFNSHHQLWGYNQPDQNGEVLCDWCETNSLQLVYDAKDKSTFYSARWRAWYNPDLCFTSMHQGEAVPCVRQVLGKFPNSQHCPAILTVGTSVPIVRSLPVPRWHIRRANWKLYSKIVERTIGRIEPNTRNYNRFLGLLRKAAATAVPRGYRKEYVPCWSSETTRLAEKFKQDENPDTASDLIKSLNDNRKKRWEEVTGNLDFRHSSRKAWALLRRLGSATQQTPKIPRVTPDQVAAVILKNSKVSVDNSRKRNMRRDATVAYNAINDDPDLSRPFTVEEVNTALKMTKPNKAAGEDGILPEFLLNLGTMARLWIAKFATYILNSSKIPPEWTKSKIIALLKPSRPAADPKNYRPISLLPAMYKLIERLILNRIQPEIEKCLPAEQAGFRMNRSCSEQVLALTTHIEVGFQKRLKTAAAFVDLTSAYDTVWHDGLRLKLCRAIRSRPVVQLITQMISNRTFNVSLGGKTSRQRRLQNGLPQGSVLAPALFNLYISDLPDTNSRKFIYADDIAITAQDNCFTTIERTLSQDLQKLCDYFKLWKLKCNFSKTVTSCFHLDNHAARRVLNITAEGTPIEYTETPKYLGVTLDRTLSYRQHLTNLGKKLRARTNLIQKLAGTSWGSSAGTLRVSSLSLVYSAAEYCCSSWARSSHTAKVDVQLNITMRTVTGTLRSTPTTWLPVLSNIHPPAIRRAYNTTKEVERIRAIPGLHLNDDLSNPPRIRLKSRNPVWLAVPVTDPTEEWDKQWRDAACKNYEMVDKASEQLPGFDLPRRHFVTINRIRTGHGRCGNLMYKWRLKTTPACDCGALRQTVAHITDDCPIRAFDGGIRSIHSASDSAINWMDGLDIQL